MIDLHWLLETFDGGLDDADKHEATLRFLCLTARRYNKTYEELERLKELIGFNKPFPILRLPREIRDQIYTYSLCAPISANTVSRSPFIALTPDHPFKPPTPGLLCVNKQIYYEAVDILYSKNTFKSEEPEHLFTFEAQIGLENCKRVKTICFWTLLPTGEEEIPDPNSLPRSEYQSVPSHWIAALKACDFRNIVHLGIDAEMLFSDPLGLFSMPKDLQEFIEGYLGRVTDNGVPHLSLTGFREEEREKFPNNWKVVMNQWSSYEEELESLGKECEEDYDTQWMLDPGSSEDEDDSGDGDSDNDGDGDDDEEMEDDEE